MKTPSGKLLRERSFVTYRRMWLDFYLALFKDEMRGITIDLGGKQIKKRGTFILPQNNSRQCWYLNLALDTKPDIIGSVEDTPFQSACADTIICTEVLEHIPHPQKCADEILRILKPGGLAFTSVPFLYPIHADPYDFQRFTSEGLARLFNNYSQVEIFSMGSYPGVMGLFLEIGADYILGQNIQKKLLRRIMHGIARHLYAIDLSNQNQPQGWHKFTTGYFVKAKK